MEEEEEIEEETQSLPSATALSIPKETKDSSTTQVPPTHPPTSSSYPFTHPFTCLFLPSSTHPPTHPPTQTGIQCDHVNSTRDVLTQQAEWRLLLRRVGGRCLLDLLDRHMVLLPLPTNGSYLQVS